MISADSHVLELPDLFTRSLGTRFADAVPRVEDIDGTDWWIVDGAPQVPAVNPSRAGDRFEAEEERRQRAKVDSDARLGGFDPDEFVTDNESDGVWGAVLFPSMSLIFYGMRDSALLSAVCRTYTDWVIDFASAHPERLKALAMINLDDVPAAVAELERARGRGAAGALIPVTMPDGRTYDHEMYEPFWAAAAALGMPLNLHVATNRTPDEWKRAFKLSENLAAPDYWVRVSLADLIMSGVFERHPDLRVGSVEHEAGWAPFFVRRMDHMYTESIDFAKRGWRFADGAVPSDFFHRNAFVSFCEDDVAVRHRDVVGVENLMWGNDYPHGESTFPRSREIVATTLAGLTEAERHAMTAGNVARLYGFAPPRT
jgi:predicted TIM-barrel fold metal-dependent hydrolase